MPSTRWRLPAIGTAIVSGAKSDSGDAKMLADLVRTDRHNHRPSGRRFRLVEAIKVFARAHQNAIWAVTPGQRPPVRTSEYYPAALEAFGTELTSTDALGVLAWHRLPELGRQLSRAKLVATLRRAGRQRNVDPRAETIQVALRRTSSASRHAEWCLWPLPARRFGMIIQFNAEIAELEGHSPRIEQHRTEDHPLLAGTGDDPRRPGAGRVGDDHSLCRWKVSQELRRTSPVPEPRAKPVGACPLYQGRRLADALDQWAFCSLTKSEGARGYYDQLRSRDKTHRQALRQLANRWVGTSRLHSTTSLSMTKRSPGRTLHPPPLNEYPRQGCLDGRPTGSPTGPWLTVVGRVNCRSAAGGGAGIGGISGETSHPSTSRPVSSGSHRSTIRTTNRGAPAGRSSPAPRQAPSALADQKHASGTS